MRFLPLLILLAGCGDGQVSCEVIDAKYDYRHIYLTKTTTQYGVIKTMFSKGDPHTISLCFYQTNGNYECWPRVSVQPGQSADCQRQEQ